MHNTESVLENEMHKIRWDFLDINGSPNLGQTTRPSDSQQKRRMCGSVDFAVSADHRVK